MGRRLRSGRIFFYLRFGVLSTGPCGLLYLTASLFPTGTRENAALHGIHLRLVPIPLLKAFKWPPGLEALERLASGPS